MASVRSRRCVVIGAGVLGASVADRLASAGLQVTLLEQDQPGRATSRWSFAWLNSNDKAPRPYHDLNHAGILAWAELAPDFDGAAWYRPVGHLELATTDAGRAELEARARRLTDWGYPARLVSQAEASELEPALRFPESGTTVAWFPGEGYVLTEPLIARLVARAASNGADVRTGDPGRVTGLDPGPAETLRVRTAAGPVLEADEVVGCAGRWVPELAEMAGSPCPVPLVDWEKPGAAAPGLVVRAGPLASAGPVRLVHTSEVSLRPHAGGLLHLEAPDAAVDLHTPEPDLRRWAATLLRRAQQTVRGLIDARVEEFQVCVRPMPADGQSIVGCLPGAPSLYIAVTHSGVTLAAHLSRLIATELTTGTPPADLAPYRPARFLTSPSPPASPPPSR
ncbi:MAG: NAD(P)/FAD-dependent oxidoreductase [Streptosporangiaceae bacterium]